MISPDIKDVLTLLGIGFHGNKITENFNCIFCNDTNKHMNVNYKKNVWNCPRCGKYGGALRLYAQAHCISLEQASDEISMKNSDPSWRNREVCNVTMEDTSTPIAADAVLNKTYTCLLNMLSLIQEDVTQLMSRGLTHDDIIQMGFKSTVDGKNYEIAEKLIQKGCTLKGVAGFVQYNGRWCFYCNAQGIMIPYRNINGDILGFQIRKRDNSKRKYVWLSTAAVCQVQNTRYTNGCKSRTSAHVIGYANQSYIYLTEGALKGDVAYGLSAQLFDRVTLFACIAGVSAQKNLRELLGQLKKTHVKTIIGCFDMDQFMNPIYNKNVERSVQALKKIIKSYGFKYEERTWDYCYKGVDDFFLYQMECSKTAA